jgi:hypothetical protein
MGGGPITPQHPPPPHAAPFQPATEPRQLGCGFLAQTPPHLAFCECTAPPPPPAPCTRHQATPTHHPPSPFHTARPKPSHNSSVLAQPPPHLAFHGRTASPPPAPPPPCTHHHATSMHHPPSPFHTALPNPSRNGAVSGFRPNPSPPCISRACSPTTTTSTSYAPPLHPYAPSPFTILHGAPEIKPQRLGFGFLAQTPSPASCLQTQRPTTTITSSAPPHQLPPLLSTLISDGASKIEPQWLGLGFLALNLI